MINIVSFTPATICIDEGNCWENIFLVLLAIDRLPIYLTSSIESLGCMYG